MISVPARRVKQFGVEFYQAGLSAKDIDRLVKFEVLGYSGGPEPEPAKGRKPKVSRARVNWDMLEKRISESETAYQRPVIRRKIDELAAYYRECKDAATLPAIPGAVIIDRSGYADVPPRKVGRQPHAPALSVQAGAQWAGTNIDQLRLRLGDFRAVTEHT